MGIIGVRDNYRIKTAPLSGGMVPIETIRAETDVTSIKFEDIPQTFQDIKFIGMCRSTYDDFDATPPNDRYPYCGIRTNGDTDLSNQNYQTNWDSYLPYFHFYDGMPSWLSNDGASNPPIFGRWEINLPAYREEGKVRYIESIAGYGLAIDSPRNNVPTMQGWKTDPNNAANPDLTPVTAIEIFYHAYDSTDNFIPIAAGSYFTMYGIISADA